MQFRRFAILCLSVRRAQSSKVALFDVIFGFFILNCYFLNRSGLFVGPWSNKLYYFTPTKSLNYSSSSNISKPSQLRGQVQVLLETDLINLYWIYCLKSYRSFSASSSSNLRRELSMLELFYVCYAKLDAIESRWLMNYMLFIFILIYLQSKSITILIALHSIILLLNLESWVLIIKDTFILQYIFMSVQLLKKIQQSRKAAVLKGDIISIRAADLVKDSKQNKHTKLKYSWYQTPTKVGIQIPYRVQKKQALQVKFQKNKVSISFPLQTGGEYHLELNLYREIVTSRTKKIHRLENIQIMMEKKQQNISWFSLTKDATSLEDAEQTQQISYPSSNKTKKNWDKISDQIEKDIMKHPEQYAVDPSMLFFQEIFKNADPDKRKAMMKSFQTSSGTVLSTDWSDVSKKDYEGKDRPSPPKGQEWRQRQL